jgi:hypothetical protein
MEIIILPIPHLRQRGVPHSLLHGIDMMVLERETERGRQRQKISAPNEPVVHARDEARNPHLPLFLAPTPLSSVPRTRSPREASSLSTQASQGHRIKRETFGLGFFSDNVKFPLSKKIRERTRRSEKLFSHSPTHRRRDLRIIGIFPLREDPPGERRRESEREIHSQAMLKSTTGPRGTWKKFLPPPDRISTISRADRAIVGTHTHTRSPAAPSLWLAKERALLGGRRAVDFTLVTTIIVIVIVAMDAEMELLLRWNRSGDGLFCRWNRSGDGLFCRSGWRWNRKLKREEKSTAVRMKEGRNPGLWELFLLKMVDLFLFLSLSRW